MVIVSAPTPDEIDEVLRVVARSHRLTDILPDPPRGMAYADYMVYGWVYLFYSDDLRHALGYVWFEWRSDSPGTVATIPHLHFCGTSMASTRDVLTGIRIVRRVISNCQRGVKAYITGDRIAKLARSLGFAPIRSWKKQNRNTWYHGPQTQRSNTRVRPDTGSGRNS